MTEVELLARIALVFDVPVEAIEAFDWRAEQRRQQREEHERLWQMLEQRMNEFARAFEQQLDHMAEVRDE